MAWGLNLYNAQGGAILDTTQRTGQLSGVHSFYGPTPGNTVDLWGSMNGSYQSITAPNGPANSILWYVIVSTGFDDYQNGSGYSQIYNTGQTIYYRTLNNDWTYIYYGYR
ncbi:hypothetical protein KRZ98_18315 [Sphingobium sp. AS12]|uniref:hypothetical protein n=1 Tax=Sphingobium sp. AS12 TaxID=2849495 RepID=UPI001C3156A2|nr:hypothetical protein [Sphingobium sp. AS12]MBV2150193.1 hypothetical protein [Sphingobium sp. AS12]